MYKKSLVSIYLSKRFLHILQLSAKKNKVIKNASIPIPEDIFSRGDIVDTETFGAFLKGIWEKLDIKEKTVGIAIPEASTFTKLLSVPKVSATELDEAVRWQVQDAFPVEQEKLIVDWKLVYKKDTEYCILLVAAYKDILNSIVISAEKAGLYPVLVLTPAVAIAELVNSDKPAIIVVRNSESLVCLVEGDKLYASSIITETDEDAIVRTALQIVNHYKKVTIEAIFLSGADGNNDLVTKLTDALHAPVKTIDKKVSGLTADQMQENIVSLSLQFAPLAEPSDITTLNLLPYHLVQKYNHAKSRIQLWSISLTMTLFSWTMLSLAAVSLFFLSNQTADIKKQHQNQASVTSERTALDQKISDINTVTAQVLKVKEVSHLPEEVLNIVFIAKPPGVLLSRYEMDLDKGTVAVRGIASDRQSLIDFKQNLEKSEDIDKVEIPISSFETEIDVEFQAAFSYLPITTKSKVTNK